MRSNFHFFRNRTQFSVKHDMVTEEPPAESRRCVPLVGTIALSYNANVLHKLLHITGKIRILKHVNQIGVDV